MPASFQVVIPVVNTDLADTLIANINANTLLPRRIIIIDNSGCWGNAHQTDYPPYRAESKTPIDYYYSVDGYVNESWNLGISKVDPWCDIVSILNDDIQIPPWFFQRMAEILVNPKVGVACPATISGGEPVPLVKHSVLYDQMGKREGWAMNIRKSLLNTIPPIPSHLIETFHGDDWFWIWARIRGLSWMKDRGCHIWHRVGSSILPFGFRQVKAKERESWTHICQWLESNASSLSIHK